MRNRDQYSALTHPCAQRCSESHALARQGDNVISRIAQMDQ